MVLIGNELNRIEPRYTKPKLEIIDYYDTIYKSTKRKKTEETQFIKNFATVKRLEHMCVGY